MQRTDFFYELPEELIAQTPPARRSASRLLGLDGEAGRLHDGCFEDLYRLVRPGDLLICNDTRVIPARLFGRKETGGKVEILVERILDRHHALVQLRSNRPVQCGTALGFGDGIKARVESRDGDFFRLHFPGDQPVGELLKASGHMPLPPYIKRPDNIADRQRYQTVYAREPGAVAAPTAGLHFDHDWRQRFEDVGVELAFVTLHVGAGTFQPVRVDALEEHRMHAEFVEVGAEVGDRVAATRQRGGRVVAVGTTTLRALEAAAVDGKVAPFHGDTRLFIYPGYRFRVVDALLTNFHLPESTLLMLVCAFGGVEEVMAAYRHAVQQRYRFFSYGDAMFLNRKE